MMKAVQNGILRSPFLSTPSNKGGGGEGALNDGTVRKMMMRRRAGKAGKAGRAG